MLSVRCDDGTFGLSIEHIAIFVVFKNIPYTKCQQFFSFSMAIVLVSEAFRTQICVHICHSQSEIHVLNAK